MNNNTTPALCADPMTQAQIDALHLVSSELSRNVWPAIAGQFTNEPVHPLKPADCVAGSKYFENYTDAGAEVKKVLRSVVILRVFPGESYESENYGAIVEMTDGRVLTLVTDSYYGTIDEWDRAEAEAQLAMVEENAAELRAVLGNWPDERKAPVMDAKPTLMFAPGTTVTPELLSAAQALLTNEWARLPSTHRAEFHRGAEGETLIIVDSLEPAPAEEAPLSLDEICAQAGVDRAEYERVRAAAGLPPHGSLGEMPFDVRAPAYAFAVSRGHSQEEAEAFAEFVDKHPFSIRSNLPLNAETFDAAHAFAQAAVVKVELSEEAARRLEYLAKRPVVIPSPIMSAKSYQRVKDAATTRWEKAVWDASDADLLAIAERYSPGEVDEYARSRVAGATGYSLMNGNGCPDAWLDLADEAVREHEELEQWEWEQEQATK